MRIDERLLARTLDHLSDGVAVVNEDGRLVYTSAPFETLFGYGPGALIGREVESLLPEARRQSHVSERIVFHRRRRAREMGRQDLDIVGRRGDGSEFPVDIRLGHLPGTDLIIAEARALGMGDPIAERIERADAERESKAREKAAVTLLDTAIQYLFGVSATLMSLAARVDGESGARLHQCIEELDSLIGRIRNEVLEHDGTGRRNLE